MQPKKNSYNALIWGSEPTAAGKRVIVIAENHEQARLKLEKRYGRGAVFDLHDEPDASMLDDKSST